MNDSEIWSIDHYDDRRLFLICNEVMKHLLNAVILSRVGWKNDINNLCAIITYMLYNFFF